MSFSSGVFSINTAGQPVVTGTVISSTAFNALTQDLATGLSTCVLKDGTQTLTANLPMSGFKLTGLAAGSASGDSLRYEQVFGTGNPGTAYKVGTFTRDMTAASGDVAYTGVGFNPKAIVFFSTVSLTTAFCVGLLDASSSKAIFQNIPGGADSFQTAAGNSIYLTNTAGTAQSAVLSSLDTDGFTLTWTKAGLPTGTADIYYLALR